MKACYPLMASFLSASSLLLMSLLTNLNITFSDYIFVGLSRSV